MKNAVFVVFFLGMCCFSLFLFVTFVCKNYVKMKMKVSKRKITVDVVCVLLIVLLFKLVFSCGGETGKDADKQSADSVALTAQQKSQPVFFDKDGKEKKSRIYSVPHFGNTFPDQNDVQLMAAQKHGVEPVRNRDEAEGSKGKLVYVGCNPYYHVDKLKNSIPYLVPHAAVLLQDIGRNYFDSLQMKGIPLHKIIVTSILRTEEDVEKLRTRNSNATVNSCHLYGTTFDICYNRYKTVMTSDAPRREVRNDSLKWVLSEVLRDLREEHRCFVKYEVKQGCFHITVN